MGGGLVPIIIMVFLNVCSIGPNVPHAQERAGTVESFHETIFILMLLQTINQQEHLLFSSFSV